MQAVNYDKLYEELIEQYPIDDNPEIYSLYTSMLQHLMKVLKLKHSTAVKLLLRVEEHLGIHLMRDCELTNMQMLKLKKNEDVNRYFRAIYWYNKLPLETLDAIIKMHGDVNKRLVKEYLHKNGKMSETKFSEFTYAQQYYKSHKEQIKEKKRKYRQKKRLAQGEINV